MKQIYNFEQHNPPVLNENMLNSELERRKLRWQTALIAVGGILMQAVIVMFGFTFYEIYPVFTAICLGYVLISITGSGILAVVVTRKGGL